LLIPPPRPIAIAFSRRECGASPTSLGASWTISDRPSPAAVKRFLREAKIQARLEHPSI
jgi:hypothetical protein